MSAFRKGAIANCTSTCGIPVGQVALTQIEAIQAKSASVSSTSLGRSEGVEILKALLAVGPERASVAQYDGGGGFDGFIRQGGAQGDGEIPMGEERVDTPCVMMTRLHNSTAK